MSWNTAIHGYCRYQSMFGFFIMTLKEIFTLDALNHAYYECGKMSRWKESTQRYGANLLLNNKNLRAELLAGKYKASSMTKFRISERGKIRDIEAPAMRDRIVQKVLCQKVLIPYLTKSLIYDNYASLKNRGTTMARKRIVAFLRRFIMEQNRKGKNPNDGYILQMDIRHYFPSIDHEVLRKLVHDRISEPKEVLDLIDYIIDISSDSNKGVNLGSEAPQIFAIYYLSQVDSLVKNVLGVKKYGRYMDDMFIIHEDKAYLETIRDNITQKLAELKLQPNQKKTHIVKLSHGFTFMQIKYNIVNGKIIRRPTHTKIVRERRKLKKFCRMKNEGRFTSRQIYDFYRSWLNGIDKDCKNWNRTKMAMQELFFTLFPDIEKKRTYNRNVEIFRFMRHNAEDFPHVWLDDYLKLEGGFE